MPRQVISLRKENLKLQDFRDFCCAAFDRTTENLAETCRPCQEDFYVLQNFFGIDRKTDVPEDKMNEP